MAAPRIIDYSRIEPGWRAGILSVQQLADDYREATGQAVTVQAINKHFKKLGIPRDLTAKIEAKAAAMVQAAMVQGMVQISGDETLPADAAIIKSAATSVANVQLSHRADIRKLRDRVLEYEAELSDCSDDLSKRTSILKSLAETQCRLIAAEREAFGMDKDARTEDELSGESLATLKRIKARLDLEG